MSGDKTGEFLTRHHEGRGYRYAPAAPDAATIAVRNVVRDFGDAAVSGFLDEARADPAPARAAPPAAQGRRHIVTVAYGTSISAASAHPSSACWPSVTSGRSATRQNVGLWCGEAQTLMNGRTEPSLNDTISNAPALSPLIPGDPPGMPGRAMPSTAGRSCSSRSIASTGT